MNGSSGEGDQVIDLAIEPDDDDAERLQKAFDDAKLVNDLHVIDNGDEALDFLH